MSESTNNTAWQQLSSRLSQSPNNLKLHVQRILFCLDNHLSDIAAGSLQDLFIVLQDDKGKDLRLRMFNLVSPLLDHDERYYFQHWLENGRDNTSGVYEYNNGSLFAKVDGAINNKLDNN